MRLFDRASQPLEFANAGGGVVALDPNSFSLSRLRLDSIRVRRPPTLPQCVEAASQLLAADECQNGIDSVRRELARDSDNVVALAIDRLACAEAADEVDAVASGCYAEVSSASHLCKLQR